MSKQNLQSMTGFARCEASGEWGSATWELRSVNSRYLELLWRLPEALRELEPSLRESARNTLTRGKVECHLKLQIQSSESVELHLNQALLHQWQSAACLVETALPPMSPYTVVDVMQWPDMVQTHTKANPQLCAAVDELFVQALNQLQQSRAREGQALLTVLQEKCAVIQQHLVTLKTLLSSTNRSVSTTITNAL